MQLPSFATVFLATRVVAFLSVTAAMLSHGFTLYNSAVICMSLAFFVVLDGGTSLPHALAEGAATGAAATSLNTHAAAGLPGVKSRSWHRGCGMARTLGATALVVAAFALGIASRFRARQTVMLMQSFNSMVLAVTMTLMLVKSVAAIRQCCLRRSTRSDTDDALTGMASANGSLGTAIANALVLLDMLLPPMGVANIILGICRVRPRLPYSSFIPLSGILFLAFALTAYVNVFLCCGHCFASERVEEPWPVQQAPVGNGDLGGGGRDVTKPPPAFREDDQILYSAVRKTEDCW